MTEIEEILDTECNNTILEMLEIDHALLEDMIEELEEN